MCARARTFQASLERDFRTDHPNGDHNSVFHAELKTLLTTYYEDLRKVVGASGQEATRVLKHRRSIEPPPASGDNVPSEFPGVTCGRSTRTGRRWCSRAVRGTRTAAGGGPNFACLGPRLRERIRGTGPQEQINLCALDERCAAAREFGRQF